MEEDIEILESECYYLEELGYLRENNHFIRFNQALGNLIKGYRELEKQLDSSRKANELLNKTNNELRLEIRTTDSKVVNDIISKFNLGDEYIPISKIKEKMGELNKEEKGLRNSISAEEYAEYSDSNISFDLMHIEIQRSVLQELMEDK